MYIYTCEVCGKNYIESEKWHSRHTCCEECYKKRKSTEAKKKYRARPKKVSEMERIRRKSKLESVNAQASASNMSYGQYQAMMYLRRINGE